MTLTTLISMLTELRDLHGPDVEVNVRNSEGDFDYPSLPEATTKPWHRDRLEIYIDA